MKKTKKIGLLLGGFILMLTLTQGYKTSQKKGAGLLVQNAYAATSPTSPANKPAVTVQTVKGTITSIDVVKNTFILKEEGKNTTMTFSAKPETIKKLVVEEKVQVMYKKAADGSCNAVEVNKVIEKK